MRKGQNSDDLSSNGNDARDEKCKLERSLFVCSNTKRRKQFEVVSGERYQHELVKLSKRKDAVLNVKKCGGQSRGSHRRYLP